jgi:hypothetical protein
MQHSMTSPSRLAHAVGETEGRRSVQGEPTGNSDIGTLSIPANAKPEPAQHNALTWKVDAPAYERKR